MTLKFQRLRRSLIAGALAAMTSTGSAWAHGGATIEEDICGRRLSQMMIHFSLYQPQVDDKAEYCATIPSTGAAILVVDLVDYVLRFKPMALKVLDLTEEGKEKVLISLPARTYPQGVIKTDLRFEKAGRYAAVISKEEDEHDVSSKMGLLVAPGNSNFMEKNPIFWVIFGIAGLALLRAARQLWRSSRAA